MPHSNFELWIEHNRLALRNRVASAAMLATTTALAYQVLSRTDATVRLAAGLAASAVGVLWTRTRPTPSYREGCRLLHHGEFAAAERAFGWGIDLVEAQAGLAEARWCQSEAELSVALPAGGGHVENGVTAQAAAKPMADDVDECTDGISYADGDFDLTAW